MGGRSDKGVRGMAMDWEDMLVGEEITVLEAMAHLDKTAKKVLFVHREKKLLAALTDGDVRRWILAKGSLDTPVKKVANYKPIYLTRDEIYQADAYMRRCRVEALPVVNDDMVIEDVIGWQQSDEDQGQITPIDLPVVMMAGGKGTRLYPYTQILPKPLIPVGEIPIAEHIINKFRRFGCKDFYLIVNHKKNMIKAYFNEIARNYNVTYVDEEEPLGTGGGLSLLKGKLDSTFILTNCDILINEDFAKICKWHQENHHVITMICSLKNFRVPYGIVELEEQGKLKSMKEKPTFSFFTNTGCYIVEPEVVAEMEDNQAVGFTDIIEKYKKQGRSVGVYPIGENAWLDMGQMDEFERMRKSIIEE